MPRHRALKRTSRRQVWSRLGVLLVILSLAVASPALAFWQASGAGAGTGTTGTLAAPTSVIVPAEATTSVAVQWTAPSGALSPSGYVVTRSNGTTLAAACGSSASSLIPGTSCTDYPGADGTYTYAVTAVYRSWTAVSASSASVRVAAATNLAFTVQPSTTAAGFAISPPVSVTVRSADNSAVHSAGIAVTVAIAANPATGTLAGTRTRLTSTAGVATFDDLTIDQVGVGYTLSATSPGLTPDTSTAFTIVKPPLVGPSLGSATTYSAFGSAVTLARGTSLSGDLGAQPTTYGTGLLDSTIQGETHFGDAVASKVLADLTAAYTDAQSRPVDYPDFSGDQSGAIFYPGVHHTGAAFALAASKSVTLDAMGDSNAVFIFQINGALNTAAGSTITLIHGATASHVFWAATGAAGTGENSSFSGTILAAGVITIGARGTLIGRALGMGAFTTLETNTIRFTVALPPTITIDGGSTASTANRTPKISGRSTALAGTTVTITIGNQTLTTSVLSDQTWTTTATTLTPGTYPVLARVRDADSNAASASQNLAVAVPPLVGPSLGSATTYSAFGSTVTNTLVSSLSGDLGTSATTASGFPDGTVQGETHTGDASAAQALSDFTTAYRDALSRNPDTSVGGAQSGATLYYPGVHYIGGAFSTAVNSNLTLDARNNSNAVFIFQINGALSTGAGSTITLIHGATASHVFWAATGAASTGENSTFSGTILATGAITIGANSTLIGRALGMGALILAADTIRFTVALPPTITIDGGPTASTANRTPTISGTSTALAGTTVTITIGNQTLTTPVLSDNSWTTTATTLTPGTYPVLARVRDADSNAASASQTLAVQ